MLKTDIKQRISVLGKISELRHKRFSGHNKRGLPKLKFINNQFAICIGVFLSCFVLAFVAGSFIIQPQGTKAVTGLTLVTAPTMSLSVNSSSVALSPNPTSNDGLASSTSTLTASTNVPTGYNLSITATSTGTKLKPTTGTIASPTALTSNSWGYALTKTGAVGVNTGFDLTYAYPTPSASSKWANPTAAATVKNVGTAVANDTTDVYYGAKVDMSLPSGTYSSTITYSATANISSIETPSILSLQPTSGDTAGGTAIQIVGTGFAVNDQSVTTSVTIDGAACEGVSISSNTPVIGKDTIYCNTPAHAAGAADIAVTTWTNTATLAGGYTYVTPATVSFVSPSLASTIAGTESGPAFTIAGTGFTGATAVTIGGTACADFEVMSDTHIFCKAPNTINTTGNKAVLVKTSMDSNSDVAVSYGNTDYPTLQSGDAYANCSTTAKLYRDIRDSQLYYVKRMPDQKCWMVDNLKYICLTFTTSG